MPEIRERFVDYAIYCKKCKYKDKNGWEDPCNECMSTPVAMSTTKPVKYEEYKNSQ